MWSKCQLWLDGEQMNWLDFGGQRYCDLMAPDSYDKIWCKHV